MQHKNFSITVSRKLFHRSPKICLHLCLIVFCVGPLLLHPTEAPGGRGDWLGFLVPGCLVHHVQEGRGDSSAEVAVCGDSRSVSHILTAQEAERMEAEAGPGCNSEPLPVTHFRQPGSVSPNCAASWRSRVLTREPAGDISDPKHNTSYFYFILKQALPV